MQRLVLGCGTVRSSLVERLADRSGNLLVLADDERVETLREEGIDARRVDITDPDAIRTVAGPVDTVVVTPAETGRVRELSRIARVAYPEAFVFACAGREATTADLEALQEHADRVHDPISAAVEYLDDRIGGSGLRTRKLLGVLRRIDGRLAIVTHDNPDPDAIAAAVALKRIAAVAGIGAEVCYYGEINHQENRALVNLLGFELRNLDPDEGVEEFAGVALVDHSRSGVNDGLSNSTPVDIVIDHHPPRAPVEARFVDLRSDVGATSTLLSGYLDQLGIEPNPSLATGLLYGIRSDTDDFSRGVVPADLEAAAELVELSDNAALQQIESPSIATDTIELIGRAIRNRRLEDDILTTCVGELSDRDALAQAADRLLDMEGVTAALVFGYTDETVFVSARARGTEIDLGETLREAFDQIGSAGGHADMAGAQIPVGMLIESDDESDRREIIEAVVVERFFEALGVEPDRAAAAVYTDFFGTHFHEE